MESSQRNAEHKIIALVIKCYNNRMLFCSEADAQNIRSLRVMCSIFCLLVSSHGVSFQKPTVGDIESYFTIS